MPIPLLAGLVARLAGGAAARGAAGAAARGAASTAGKDTFKRMAFKAGKKILKDKFENALEGSSGESSSGESYSGESASGGTGPKFNIMKNLGMMGAKFNSINSSVGGSALNGNSPATAIRINRNADMTSSLSALNRQMNVMIRVLGSIDSTLKDQLKLQQDQFAGSRETNLENKPGEVVSGGLNSLIGGDGQSGGGGGLMKMVMGFLKGGSVISMLAPLLIPLVAVVAGGLFGVGKSFFKKVGEFFSGDKKDEDATQIPTPDSAVTPNTPVSGPTTTTPVPENLKLDTSTPLTGNIPGLARSFLDEQKSKPMSSGTNTTVTPVQNSSNYMANPYVKPTKTYTAKSGATATPSATPSSKPSATPSGSKDEKEQKTLAPGVSGGPKTAYEFFKSKGWSSQIAAGIVGNLQQESTQGLNPNAIRENDAGPGLHSYGIAQWNRGRYAGLKAFASSRGKPWNHFTTQLEYVQHEFNNDEYRARNHLLALQAREHTPEEAAALVDKHYERSTQQHTYQRMQNARKLYGGKFAPPSDAKYMGEGGGSGSSGGGDWRSKLAGALQKIPLLPGVRQTADAASDLTAMLTKPKTPTPKLERGNKGMMTEGLTFKSTDKATSLVPQPKPKTPTPQLRKRRDSSPQSSSSGRSKVSNRDVPNPSASSIIREYQLYFTSRV